VNTECVNQVPQLAPVSMSAKSPVIGNVQLPCWYPLAFWSHPDANQHLYTTMVRV
jgi:hypothetical protein